VAAKNVTNAAAACPYLTKRDANVIQNLASIAANVPMIASAAVKKKPKKTKKKTKKKNRASLDFFPGSS
jgi:hypothetical protein